MLNRSVLIVRPAEPFIKWLSGLGNPNLVPSTFDEETVYLIPEYEDAKAANRILKTVWSEVFERELYEWHTDLRAWPKKRTFKMFKLWFVIEFHSVVEDLCASELYDDED